MAKSFEVWMQQIDALLLRASGMTHEDLPDLPYREYWENDRTPISVARKALDLA